MVKGVGSADSVRFSACYSIFRTGVTNYIHN